MPTIPEYVQRTGARANLPVGSTSHLTRAIGNELARGADIRKQNQEEDAALWATNELSQAQVQWTEELINRRESAEAGAPGFTDSVLKDFDEFAEEAAGRAPTTTSREYMQQRLAAYRVQIANQSLGFEANERVAHTVSTVEGSIEAGRVQANQAPERYGELVAERLTTIDELRLDANTKRELRETAQTTIARDAVMGMIDNDPEGALEALNSPHGESNVLAIEALSADDRLRLVESAERTVLQGIAAEEAAKQKAFAKVASDLEIGVYRGEGSRFDIDKAMQDEVISPAKRTQLHLEMDRQQAEMVSNESVRNLVRISRGLGIPLDPGDTDHRKAVEFAYNELQLAPFTPEHTLEAGRLIQETGIVPKQLQSMVRAMAVSGSAEQALAVADLVDHIQTVAPSTIGQFSDTEKAFALSVQEMVRAGTDPATAVNLARERVFKTPDREIIGNRYRDESKDNDDRLNDFIDDDFDTFLSFQPEAPPLMQAEFDSLAQNYFLKTQDIESARSLAWKDLKGVWDLTEINGQRELMKYAPKTTERNGLKENMRIVSDLRTGRDGTYSVIETGDDGLPRIQPFRWAPDAPEHQDYTNAVDSAKSSRELLAELEYQRDNAQALSVERIEERRAEFRARLEGRP